MSYFSYRIHTDSSFISSNSEPYSAGRVAAAVIKDVHGKVISEGKQTERLSLVARDSIYSLAIQTVSLKDQEQIKKQGHAGWWKSFFWKPLTLQTAEGEVTVLVNIQSAVKRLNHLGLSKKEITEELEWGTLIHRVQKAYVEEELKKGKTKATVYSEIFSEDITNKTADEIHDYHRVGGHYIQGAYRLVKQQEKLEIHYQKVLGCSMEVARLLVKQLWKQKIQMDDMTKIANFIEKNKSKWAAKAKSTNQPVYIRKEDFLGQIPRNMQVNPDGTIYILFNRVSKGDRLFGRGTYKTAKTALNLIDGEMYARLAMQLKNKEEKELAVRELGLSGRVQNQKGIMGIDSCTVVYYDSKRNGQKIGYMQKLCNGGDLQGALNDPIKPTEKEKFLITKRILQGMSWLHKEGIIHRDLKAPNLFLIKDPKTNEIVDCVVADLGLACDKKDDKERQKLVGSPLYMSPEYFLAFWDVSKQRLVSIEKMRKVNADSTDNWGIGLILYELFKEDIPEWKWTNPIYWLSYDKERKTYKDFERALKNYQANSSFPTPKDPDSIGHVIMGLLHPDPAQRMTAADALAKADVLIKKKGFTIS